MTVTATLERARELAGAVVDPELPMLTLADLGVLRDVRLREGAEGVEVVITPTYTGCPALATMRDDLVRVLREAGFAEVEVQVRLSPAWSTDQISERGRTALAAAGISPPGAAPQAPRGGPVPLSLTPTRRAIRCPRCGSPAAEVTSEFGPTACTALYRCRACDEPFQHVKEI